MHTWARGGSASIVVDLVDVQRDIVKSRRCHAEGVHEMTDRSSKSDKQQEVQSEDKDELEVKIVAVVLVVGCGDSKHRHQCMVCGAGIAWRERHVQAYRWAGHSIVANGCAHQPSIQAVAAQQRPGSKSLWSGSCELPPSQPGVVQHDVGLCGGICLWEGWLGWAQIPQGGLHWLVQGPSRGSHSTWLEIASKIEEWWYSHCAGLEHSLRPSWTKSRKDHRGCHRRCWGSTGHSFQSYHANELHCHPPESHPGGQGLKRWSLQLQHLHQGQGWKLPDFGGALTVSPSGSTSSSWCWRHVLCEGRALSQRWWSA